MNSASRVRSIAGAVLALAVIGTGAWGALREMERRAPAEEVPRATFWSALPAWSPGAEPGLVLNDTRLDVSPPQPEAQIERLDLRVAAAADGFTLSVELRRRGVPGGWQIQLTQAAGVSARLVRMEAGARTTVLAEGEAPGAAAGAVEQEYSAEFAPGRVRLQCAGRPLLDHAAPEFAARDLLLRLNGSGAVVRELRIGGTYAGQPFERREPFAARAPRRSRLPEAVLLAAGSVLFLALFLRALCTGSPPAREWRTATLAAAALAAIPPAVAVLRPMPWVLPLSMAATIPALWIGQFVLRRSLNAPFTPAAGRAAAWLFVAVTLSGAGYVGVKRGTAEHAAIERDRARGAEVADEPAARPGRHLLTAGNALVDPEPRRSYELRTRVELAARGVLEVRLRAYAERPQGVALLLSADPRLPTHFYRQSALENRPIGSGGSIFEPGQPLELVVRVRERRFEALVDGVQVAAARCADASTGRTVLLACRGQATVDGLEITPLPRESRPALEVAAAAGGALLAPALLLLVLGALTTALARAPWLHVAAAQAFAWVPLAAAELHGGAAAPGPAALTSLAVVLILLCHLQARGARLGGGRFALLMLAAVVLAPMAVLHAAPLDSGSAGQVAGSDKIGDAVLHDELCYLQHPVARQLNDYLTDHTFRRRSFALEKPAGGRVLALGTSSTFGYGLAPGQDYPALLEGFLNADGGERTEVMNAAWPGTNGACLYRVLRDGLADFEPDVVTLSLYYNDSFSLMQWDLDAHFVRLDGMHPLRRVLENARAQLELAAGRQRLADMLRAFSARAQQGADLWLAAGLPADEAPAVRFQAMLRRFCELGRTRGFRLVLMKEPIAGDAPRIWKDEFRAAMDAVGREFGVEVVDPTPALLAAGGIKLFQQGDEIHPKAEGNRIIAAELAPAVRRALAVQQIHGVR